MFLFIFKKSIYKPIFQSFRKLAIGSIIYLVTRFRKWEKEGRQRWRQREGEGDRGRGEIKRKYTVRGKEKIKSSFKWQACRNTCHSALLYVNVCSFSQLPICQFVIHSYQTLSKALLLCSPRHQNEASTLSIWFNKDRL